MIDAASGGALVDKILEAARSLIANMVASSQKFGTSLDLPSKNAISSLEQQIASLTSLVRQMVVVFELDGKDELEVSISKHLEKESEEFALSFDLQETVAALNDISQLQQSGNVLYIELPVSNEMALPSILQASTPDLKPVPSHLKYVLVVNGGTLPVIISCKLSAPQEEKLVQILMEHKMDIGWTIADINGISPFTCMHHILLEEGAKPSRQPQRRLNPPMMDVVKKEILKLLEVGGIYPFLDSTWVSPVQIVVASEDQEKMTFTCPFGTFAYRRMPFGLCNAPSTFQRCMCAGHVGFYRIFIKDCSKIALPLCKLLQKDVAFEFDEASKKAFGKLTELLTSTPVIQPPNWNVPFEIMCDASDYTVGAVLGQRIGKASHAIYYASRTLNDAQRNYSTTKKELLAVVFGLEKFRSYLLCTKVIVYSNHAALLYLMTKKEDELHLHETFPDEQLLTASVTLPWAQRDKVKSDAKYYVWGDPYLWELLCRSSDKKEIDKLKRELSKKFSMKNLGPAIQILGMRITRDTVVLKLSQEEYVKKVLSRFNMNDAKPVSTPLASHFRLSKE
ncbi:uncharacterized protein [Aristolochia californica]|uniref:uncharacterized protein n=1 Tax=Aristolochia californica TaxID=171875 RepID=UPI0035E30294